MASQTMANRSPPMPLLTGSTNPSIALAAMAASTALPPAFRISRATLCCQRLTGTGHPVLCNNFRSCGKCLAGNAVLCLHQQGATHDQNQQNKILHDFCLTQLSILWGRAGKYNQSYNFNEREIPGIYGAIRPNKRRSKLCMTFNLKFLRCINFFTNNFRAIFAGLPTIFARILLVIEKYCYVCGKFLSWLFPGL